ncbi:MAG: CHAT domain-containing protein [Bacteroidetes bacterium]|nr:MAG: CHAT domain-containing protein [Bacteroidota bacterium]
MGKDILRSGFILAWLTGWLVSGGSTPSQAAGDTLAAWEHYQKASLLIEERLDPAQAEALFQQALVGYAGYPQRQDRIRLWLVDAWLRQRKANLALDSLAQWQPTFETRFEPGHIFWGMYFRRLSWAHYVAGDFAACLSWADTAVAHLREDSPQGLRELAGTMVTMGNTYFRQGAYAQAGAAFYRAHTLFRRTHLGKEYAGSCNNIAIYHLTRNQYDEGLRWLHRAQEVYDSVGVDSLGLGNLYQNIGIVYHKKNALAQALPYFEKAARIRKAAGGQCERTYLESLLNLASICIALNRLDEAEAYCASAQACFSACPNLPRYEYPNIWRRRARIQAARGDTIGALALQKKALASFPEGMEYGPSKADTYIRMADLYQGLGQFQEAIRLCQSALAAIPPEERGVTTQAAGIMRRWAMALKGQGDYAGTLEQLQKGLSILQPQLAAQDLWWAQGQPEVRIDIELLHLLQNRAELLMGWSETAGAPAGCLDQAFTACRLAMGILDSMQRASAVEQALLAQQQQARTIYRLGVEIAHRLYIQTGEARWLSESFHFSERAKAALLVLSLRADRLGKRLGQPFLEQEDSLRRELAFYEQLLEKRGERVSPAQLTDWKDQQLQAQAGLQRLKDSLAIHAPAYFQAIYAPAPPEPAAVQSHLQGSRTAMVAFFQGEAHLYAYWFSADTFLYQRLPIPVDRLEAQIRELRTLIALAGPEARRLGALSHTLYTELLAPGLEALPQAPATLLVVPDGLLAYLPFAALLTEAPLPGSSFDTWPFLIRTLPVAVTHSAEWHLLASSAPLPAYQGYQAFAPGFAGKGESALALRSLAEGEALWAKLPALPGGARELAALEQTLSGQAWSGLDVSEALFKKQARGASILHLVTHGFIDDSYPLSSFLAFSQPVDDSPEDGRLFAWELYDLKIDASLVVLSACNTAVGKLSRGEGLMSLARAFHFAGSPSLIATLWPVQDQSTARLMENLYPRLAAGTDKASALAEAQQAYLAQCDPVLAHPFFWAGLVSIGDQRPLPPAPPLRGPWGLALLGFIGLLGWWGYARLKKRA